MFEDEYDSEDAIPKGFRYLYVEKDGKWKILTQTDFRSTDDVNRLQESLRKERKDHKVTKTSLQKFGDLNPEETRTQLDKIEELEAKVEAGGSPDQDKIDKLVAVGVKSQVTPLNRRIKELETENSDLTTETSTLRTEKASRVITDSVTTACEDLEPAGRRDALFRAPHIFETVEGSDVPVTRDGIPGVTPGLQPKDWLNEMKEIQPNWWPPSQNGGTRGSGNSGGSDNPWARKTWNETEQGKILVADRSRAEALSKAAGTTITGGMPSE